MAKINTPQIMTMVAIFAVLIGLIIFMRRNDEKEEFSMKKMMADAQAKAAKSMKDAKNRDRDAAARAAAAASKGMKKMFR
jgi:Na+-transporting methylmalonyl-CoA/oxaloacetate decarboxylase gamma subunit